MLSRRANLPVSLLTAVAWKEASLLTRVWKMALPRLEAKNLRSRTKNIIALQKSAPFFSAASLMARRWAAFTSVGTANGSCCSGMVQSAV